MSEEINENDKIILAFHLMWDSFPGSARLINSRHIIIASNKTAEENGFTEGVICARVGSPESHKGCMANHTLKTRTAQTDRKLDDRIRGWLPLEGYDDLFVHFTLPIPEKINV